MAGILALGLTYDDVAALPAPRVPNLRPGLLLGIGRDLFGDRYSHLVRGGAVRLQRTTHRLLDGARLPLAEVVAASSAVPGIFAPARIRQAFYIDGGVRSMCAADRAANARHLLVVAPIAGPLLWKAGQLLESALHLELARWRRRNPSGQIHFIRPNRAVASLIRHPLNVFDRGRALEAYWLAREQTAQLLAERPSLGALTALGSQEALPA